jgi:hypothetical protein
MVKYQAEVFPLSNSDGADFRKRVAYYAQLPDEVASLSSAWPPCPIMSSFQEFPQALRAEFPVVGH